MSTATLDDALKSDALQAFTSALKSVLAAPEHSAVPRSHGSGRALLAVDASLHVILQLLASGAGGKAFYDELSIARLVKINVATMSAHEVQERIAGSSDSVVFIVPPRPTTAKLIADSVRSLEGTRRCCVLWLPAATSECTLEIERQGVAGFVAQQSLALGLIPIDRDVVALCRDTVFGELYGHGDHRALTDVVRSLLAIEQHTGARIADVVCHGPFAERVHSTLQLAHTLAPAPSRRTRAVSDSNTTTASGPIDKLVVIDRMQDPLSMLLTPMTYEGLLDALLDANHGVVSYTSTAGSTDATATDSTQQSATASTTTVILNDRDVLFRDLRDVNINAVIAHRLVAAANDLVEQTRLASQSATSTQSTASHPTSTQPPVDATTSLANITALLARVPDLVKTKQSLTHHVALVHAIRARSTAFELRACVETEMAILSTSKRDAQDADAFLAEAVLRDPPLPLHAVLRLLCLCSLVRGGLEPELLHWYRRQLCHTYGHAAVLPLLVQLESLELLAPAATLTTRARRFDFASAKKRFALMRTVAADVDDDDAAPRDIDFMFPYTGYAPLSVRLVQDAVGIKYKPSARLGGMLPTSNKSAGSNASASAASTDSVWAAARDSTTKSSSDAPQRQRVLVYFVGGVTVAELAAFRFLNQQQMRFAFLVAATSVCNGSRLLRAIE